MFWGSFKNYSKLNSAFPSVRSGSQCLSEQGSGAAVWMTESWESHESVKCPIPRVSIWFKHQCRAWCYQYLDQPGHPLSRSNADFISKRDDLRCQISCVCNKYDPKGERWNLWLMAATKSRPRGLYSHPEMTVSWMPAPLLRMTNLSLFVCSAGLLFWHDRCTDNESSVTRTDIRKQN